LGDRRATQRGVQAFLARTRAACTEADVDYTLVRTDEPLDAVLLRFLGRRQGKA
jgi:hypothetical protein